ncbi:hypothetical protein CP10139811_0161A, partial [Chlamydia ibidis]
MSYPIVSESNSQIFASLNSLTSECNTISFGIVRVPRGILSRPLERMGTSGGDIFSLVVLANSDRITLESGLRNSEVKSVLMCHDISCCRPISNSIQWLDSHRRGLLSNLVYSIVSILNATLGRMLDGAITAALLFFKWVSLSCKEAATIRETRTHPNLTSTISDALISSASACYHAKKACCTLIVTKIITFVAGLFATLCTYYLAFDIHALS